MVTKPLEEVLEQKIQSYINSTKIGIRQIRIAFPYIFCMCIIKKPPESHIFFYFKLNVYANAFLRISSYAPGIYINNKIAPLDCLLLKMINKILSVNL